MGLELVAMPESARAVFEKEALPHRGALLATARRLTGRADEAEDLVQDTLLRAFRYAHRYQAGSNARAWDSPERGNIQITCQTLQLSKGRWKLSI